MSLRPTRRDVLRTSLGACAGAACAWPALARTLHVPEAELDRWFRGVCGQCGLLDPLFLGTREGALVTVKGDPLAPGGLGRLCTRGMAFPTALATAERRPPLPLLRRDRATKGSAGGLEPVEWPEALAWLAERAPAVRERPSRFAALLDVDLPCETPRVANRLLRGDLGCATVETTLRLDGMAGMVAAERSLGLPGPLGTVASVDGADLLLVVGADPAERHATLFYRMAQCQRRNGTRTVVIDSRRTLTCGLADVFVRPRVPGTDGAILRAMAHVLLREGANSAAADSRSSRRRFCHSSSRLKLTKFLTHQRRTLLCDAPSPRKSSTSFQRLSRAR